MLGTLFHWFYCLPILDAVGLILLMSAVFLGLHHQLKYRFWWRWIGGLLLAACMAAIVYVTLGNRTPGTTGQNFLIPFHSYRAVLQGGNKEILRSNFMNVVLFYPTGLLGAALLPDKWPRWCRILAVWLLFTGFSVGIEYIQYAHALGQVEIDDVIHNSLGALLGGIVGVVDLKLPTIFLKTE